LGEKKGEGGFEKNLLFFKCPFPHWIVTYFCRSTKMCYTYKRGKRKGREGKEEESLRGKT